MDDCDILDQYSEILEETANLNLIGRVVLNFLNQLAWRDRNSLADKMATIKWIEELNTDHIRHRVDQIGPFRSVPKMDKKLTQILIFDQNCDF